MLRDQLGSVEPLRQAESIVLTGTIRISAPHLSHMPPHVDDNSASNLFICCRLHGPKGFSDLTGFLLKL